MRDRLLGPSTSLTPDGPVGTGRVRHLKSGHKHNRARGEIHRTTAFGSVEGGQHPTAPSGEVSIGADEEVRSLSITRFIFESFDDATVLRARAEEEDDHQ